LPRANSGEVLIEGRPLTGDTDPIKQKIGLVPRDLALYDELSAAPLSRTMLPGSRAASAAITSMGVLMILFACARLVFHVQIAGSMAGFLGVCATFSLMTAAFGLLIAAIGKTPDATRGLSRFW
jgi:ABC-2 type transport system permease protein